MARRRAHTISDGDKCLKKQRRRIKANRESMEAVRIKRISKENITKLRMSFEKDIFESPSGGWGANAKLTDHKTSKQWLTVSKLFFFFAHPHKIKQILYLLYLKTVYFLYKNNINFYEFYMHTRSCNCYLGWNLCHQVFLVRVRYLDRLPFKFYLCQNGSLSGKWQTVNIKINILQD